MSYHAWRISYQSSEQAAQAAYQAWQQAREERDAMAAHIERLKEAGEAAALEAPAVTQAAIAWGEVCEQSPAVSLAHRDAQQQRTGIINACNYVLSMGSVTHKAFLHHGRYVYLSTRALREYADKHTEQAKATLCPPH